MLIAAPMTITATPIAEKTIVRKRSVMRLPKSRPMAVPSKTATTLATTPIPGILDLP